MEEVRLHTFLASSSCTNQSHKLGQTYSHKEPKLSPNRRVTARGLPGQARSQTVEAGSILYLATHELIPLLQQHVQRERPS